MKAILLAGIMNAGKTTQGKELAKLGFYVAVSSNILELKEAADRDFAKISQECRAEGCLVPDDVMVPVLIEHLQYEINPTQNILLDGFTRTAEQVKRVISYLDNVGYDITVCFLHLSDEVMFKRASSRGRHDDRPDILIKRMDVFYDNLGPVLSGVVRMGHTVHTINAGMEKEAVTNQILNCSGIDLCISSI